MLVLLTVCVCTLICTEIHITKAVLVKKAQLTKHPPPQKNPKTTNPKAITKSQILMKLPLWKWLYGHDTLME